MKIFSTKEKFLRGHNGANWEPSRNIGFWCWDGLKKEMLWNFCRSRFLWKPLSSAPMILANSSQYVKKDKDKDKEKDRCWPLLLAPMILANSSRYALDMASSGVSPNCESLRQFLLSKLWCPFKIGIVLVMELYSFSYRHSYSLIGNYSIPVLAFGNVVVDILWLMMRYHKCRN